MVAIYSYTIEENMRNTVVVLLAIALPWLVVGCSTDSRDLPEVFPTTVTVEMDGQPVEAAQVVLDPVDKTGDAVGSRGLTDAQGVCKLTSFDPPVEGVVPGEYLVMIRKIETITEPDPSEDDPDGYKVIEERHIVPQKYERFDKDGLTLTVTAEGPNDVTFQLEK